MDYRVDKDSKQINIYGHNHSNKKYNPPFKTLEGYLKKDYFEEHMKLKYKKDSGWLKYFNRLKNRSIYKTNVELNKEDRIIVLQTCIYGKYAGKLLIVAGKRIDWV